MHDSSSCYSFGHACAHLSLFHIHQAIFSCFSQLFRTFSTYFFYFTKFFYSISVFLYFPCKSCLFFHTNSRTLAIFSFHFNFCSSFININITGLFITNSISWLLDKNRFLLHYLTVCITYTLIPFHGDPISLPPLITRLSTFWPYKFICEWLTNIW